MVLGRSPKRAFEEIKSVLTETPTLIHYVPNLETVVCADSSSFGLGAILKQKREDKFLPVAYASRSLSSTEQRYAQIEKEALAATWACEKFRSYLIGLSSTLHTDHSPLVGIFEKKSLDELSPRLQRFGMRLMWYSFKVVYVAGKNLVTAYALSRTLQFDSNDDNWDFINLVECHIDAVVKALPVSTEKLDFIRKAIAEDKVCKEIVNFCLSGWPKHVDYDLVGYFRDCANIMFKDGLLLNGSRIFIPVALQKVMFEKSMLAIKELTHAESELIALFGGRELVKISNFTLIIAMSVHRIGYYQQNLCFLLKPRTIPGKKWHAIFLNEILKRTCN